MKTLLFTASQFTTTKWDDAEQKAKFANQFFRFVRSGYKFTVFPKWFYNRLSMTFGHIAHYNRCGFFEEFFVTAEGLQRFADITRQWPCYGDPEYTYSDVERAIQKELFGRSH